MARQRLPRCHDASALSAAVLRSASLCVAAVGLGYLATAAARDATIQAAAGPASVDEVIGAAALAGLAATSAWVALCVLLGVLATVPGALGHLAASAAAAVTPRMVSRVVAVVVGVTVAGSCSPALAADFSPAPAAPGQSLPGQSLPGQSLPGQSLPGQSLPGDPAAVTAALNRQPLPDAAVPRAGPGTDDPAWPSLDRPADLQLVTVQPGDCLWDIAARTLGPGATAEQIAAEWPRWYAHNRTLLGADPDLIHPGQRLVPPP